MSFRSATAWSAPRVGRQSSRLDEVLRAGQAHALSTGGLEGDGSIVGNKAKPFKQHGGHSFGPGYGAKKKVSPGDLGKQLTSCNDEKRRLQKRKDDCEEELARTKAENQRLNEKIAQMTMDAASARQQVQNLGQEKEELRERLMARLAKMAEAGAASGAERARQEAEIRSLLDELRSLDARVAQASQELASSQAELAGQQAVYSQEIQSLEEANTALQAERNQLQTDLEEMRANLEVLRSALAEAERALPDGTPADNAVRNAQTQWSDDEMESFLTNAQELIDASAQTDAAIAAAQAEYVNITITVDALETENDGVREAYESLQAEVRGLRASIENQIREGLDKIGKEIKTKQPSAPAVARRLTPTAIAPSPTPNRTTSVCTWPSRWGTAPRRSASFAAAQPSTTTRIGSTGMIPRIRTLTPSTGTRQASCSLRISGGKAGRLPISLVWMPGISVRHARNRTRACR